MRIPCRTLLALTLLAGCGQPPTAPTVEPVTMPRSALVSGAGDSNFAALTHARSALADTSALAGRPAEAAQALAEQEFLAAATASGVVAGLPQQVPLVLQRGRAEARAALGFRTDAPAQLAVDALYGAAEALRTNNQAGAAAAMAPLAADGNGAAAVARLNRLPPLPQSSQGLAIAYNAVQQSLQVR
jgi:hypothetical protein